MFFDKLLTLSESQFSHQLNGDNTHLTENVRIIQHNRHEASYIVTVKYDALRTLAAVFLISSINLLHVLHAFELSPIPVDPMNE